MSGAAQEDMREDGVMAIEGRAADWLMRQHDFGGWTDADQTAFDAWLAESLSHRIAFVRVKAAWNYADRLAALRPSETLHSGKVRPTLTRIVAACAVGAVVGVATAAIFASRFGEETYTTPVGGHQVIRLADASRIELNTDTVLRVAVDAGHRTVWLDKGEVLFQIKHDPAHPFVVMAGNRRIADLGTEFTVRRDGNHLEVALLSGRVWIDRVNGSSESSSALLKPGDVAITIADKMSVTKTSMQALADSLGWRSGVVVFNRTTLADAVEEFNRYNQRKLVITDPVVARIAIGGTFDARNVAAFADIAKHAIGLHVVTRGGEIVISR
jgi:transmembrane sensor